jgi:hypothetical protein
MPHRVRGRCKPSRALGEAPESIRCSREVKAVRASLFCLPSLGSRAEVEAGMADMRLELYQRMLAALSEQIRLADNLGYDSVSFTEHHFHIPGFEISNSPVMLDLYFAMQTKRIRAGQLRPCYAVRDVSCVIKIADSDQEPGPDMTHRHPKPQTGRLSRMSSLECGAFFIGVVCIPSR